MPFFYHLWLFSTTFGFSLCRKRMKFLSPRISSTRLSYKAECDHGVCFFVFFYFSSFYFSNLVFSPFSSPAPQLALSFQWWQILLVPYSPDSWCSSGHEVHEAEHKFLALSGPTSSCHGEAEDEFTSQLPLHSLLPGASDWHCQSTEWN